MLPFRNDYSYGCIDEILELLKNENDIFHDGYGLDETCRQAQALIRSKMIDNDVDIHFIVGGTLSNLTILKGCLNCYEAVISCDTGHINTHETGSIEATGHKVIPVQNCDGKLTAAGIRHCYEEHMMSFEHMVLPKVVYISNATELGTIYTLEELQSIRQVCDELGMYLMMDGARLGCAIMAQHEYSLNDLAKLCDIFSIGGTKNGALFGEAIIISNPALKKYFRFVMKQSGAMMAKGWLLGLQFVGLFKDDAFYKVAKHANDMAAQIQTCLHSLGYPLLMRSDTNQVFPILEQSELEVISKAVDFEVWGKQDDQVVVRFVTSWHTTQEEVDQLCRVLKDAKKASDSKDAKELD